ncbi:protein MICRORCHIDIA [Trifolium repens]|nr:protein MICRORCHIDIA [Trifolium repens]
MRKAPSFDIEDNGELSASSTLHLQKIFTFEEFPHNINLIDPTVHFFAPSFDPALAITSPSLHEPKEFDKVEMYSDGWSNKMADECGRTSECIILKIHNGATFVSVDKISNPRDGSPALLIHDDGGGMDSEAMRRCMSLGFSDKNSKLSIGQYGNGFKTSSMRLGADVIVFSRHLNNGNLTDIQENGINDKNGNWLSCFSESFWK